MKRFLALLALVLVLMAGTAGMASAITLDFNDDTGQVVEDPYNPPSGSPIASVTNVNWSDVGGGHLHSTSSWDDNIITFTTPTYVNNFQMTGLPYLGYDNIWDTYGPMAIAAFNAADVKVWGNKTFDFGVVIDEPDIHYADWTNWLTVDVNTAAVSKIIFYTPNPEGLGYNMNPSIDNLMINEAAAVPIPASVWLLGSGLLGLAGWRLRKR